MASFPSTNGINNLNRQFSSSNHTSQILSAKETFSVLQDLSRLLNTGLDQEGLSLCVRLCENGANPEALATVIKEIRSQSEAIKQQVARGFLSACLVSRHHGRNFWQSSHCQQWILDKVDLSREGLVNAFHLRRNCEIVPSYMCFYDDEETGCVFSLACAVTGEAEVTLLTAGKDVKRWRTVDEQHLPDENALLLRPTVLPIFTTREVMDSGSSDDSLSDEMEL